MMAVGDEVTLWSTAISNHESNGRQIIFRFADQFNAAFDRESQPVRIIIVWRYNSESGQPIAEEHEQMNRMEDLLEAALDQKNFATLATVSTGDDLREWTYYSKSDSEFMARLNFALMDEPRYPIEIHIARDPNWDVYEQFRSSLIRDSAN
jgi:hypothetical protein